MLEFHHHVLIVAGLLHKQLTSTPINVGLMYKLALVLWGTHSWSIETKRFMHLMNSFPSNVGNPDLSADMFILCMFNSGLKMRILPSTPRYAFIPSNSCKARMLSLHEKLSSLDSYLNGVVQYLGGGMKGYVFEGDYARLLPSAQCLVIKRFEHVIGEDLAEF